MHSRNWRDSNVHMAVAGAAGAAGAAGWTAGASERPPLMLELMALPSIEPATEPAIDEPKVPIIDGPAAGAGIAWGGAAAWGGGMLCGGAAIELAGRAGGAGAGEAFFPRDPKPMMNRGCAAPNTRAAVSLVRWPESLWGRQKICYGATGVAAPRTEGKARWRTLGRAA